MNGLIGLGGTLAGLLILGAAIGAIGRRQVSLSWLLVAAVMVAVNDALLTFGYGLLPDLVGGTWNWQGKLLALVATLAIAASPRFGRRQAGLTLVQTRGSLAAAWPVATLYAAFFIAIALVFPAGQASAEDVAFQLTMPGLEEEPFYRGILLLALDRAFAGRWRWLGVEWGWGALLSCLLFGLAHALGFSDGGFTFDPLTMALTALPAVLGVWLRLRTGSLVMPIVLHNFGNAIPLLL